MRLSELQNKDVVDILTGEKIGSIIDVDVEDKTGNIKKIILYYKKGLFNLKGSEELSVRWDKIEKIGTDVILINRN